MRRFPAHQQHTASALVALVACLSATAGAGANDRILAFAGIAGQRPDARASAFAVAGRLDAPLTIGRSSAIDLQLRNLQRHSVMVTRLTVDVRVDAAHARAGCNRWRDLRSIRMPSSSYPIVLAGGQRTSLRRLGITDLPRIALRNLSHNQDACKGAALALRFGGVARPWPPR